MLTKRQKNERYLSMFTILFGLLLLMTLFIPSAKAGPYTFMGLDIVFGDVLYQASGPVSLLFSWLNFAVYFLPITAGIIIVLVDRLMLHESKIKWVVSSIPAIMIFTSCIMLFLIPSHTVIMVGDQVLQERVEFYVGPFFAIGFIIAGLFTSVMYFIQESKIHQVI